MRDQPKKSTKFGLGNPGKPKGAVNHSTKIAREAIARLVDGNAERMQGWLDEIAETKGPEAAWRCLADVIEYHIPKLARTEHTGADGGPLRVVATSKDEAL